MKDKVVGILVGMLIMGTLAGCGQAIQTASAGENGYLKYCGKQRNVFDNQFTQVEVYEDTEHGKIVYLAQYSGESVGVSVVDNNNKK